MICGFLLFNCPASTVAVGPVLLPSLLFIPVVLLSVCRPLPRASIQTSVCWRPGRPCPDSRNRVLELKELPQPTARSSGTITTRPPWAPATGLYRPHRHLRPRSYTVYWDLRLNSKEAWTPGIQGIQRRNPRNPSRCDRTASSSFPACQLGNHLWTMRNDHIHGKIPSEWL